MSFPVFTEGQLFDSKTHGRVSFVRMDHYMGQTTYCFESHTYGGRYYWLPETLKVHLDLRTEEDRLAELERQNAELRAALREIREALQFANDNPGGGISDTLWMMHRPETLFDFIDSILGEKINVQGSCSMQQPALPNAPRLQDPTGPDETCSEV